MFGGAEISLKEQMIKLRNRLFAIRNKLPEDDWGLIDFIVPVEELYAEGEQLNDTSAISYLLKNLRKYISVKVEDPYSIWYGPYNDINNALKNKVDTTLDYMKELWGQLNPGGNIDANAPENAMPLDGGRRRKTRSRKSKTFRNNRRRMFGGAVPVLSFQEKMITLQGSLFAIRNKLLPGIDEVLAGFIEEVEAFNEEGVGIHNALRIYYVLCDLYPHILYQIEDDHDSIWYGPYNDNIDNAFRELVNSTLNQLEGMVDELNPEANGVGVPMNQDGGRRRKTRSRKSRNSRRRRRLSKRKSSKRK
jgi:hypothetical protein